MKTTTPSFITELPLRTTPGQESTILVRLDAGRQLYNACLGECLNRLSLIHQSKGFQEIQKLPKMIDGEPNDERTKAFAELNQTYGFRSQSGSLVKPAMNINKAVDVVIREDESRREFI